MIATSPKWERDKPSLDCPSRPTFPAPELTMAGSNILSNPLISIGGASLHPHSLQHRRYSCISIGRQLAADVIVN